MKTDSGAIPHQTLTKFKNARKRRLRVRRLKYTCQTKIHFSVGGLDCGNSSGDFLMEKKKNIELDSKEREMKVSLSLVQNDRVLAASKGETCTEIESMDELSYGSVSVIGSRKEMEDAVRVELGLTAKLEGGKCDFFAVYDGHGGPRVARACQERLHRLMAEELEIERTRSNNGGFDWERMMEGCFGKMDNELEENAAVRTVGCTAVVAVVTEEEVVVANCGDSRAVMGRGGEAFALSLDHKPDRPDELKRIEAAGGRIINWNGQRVLGVLSTSRSIGDQYLRPYIISKPEVTVTKRSDKDEFLILASDGLWDVISNEVACQVVRKCLGGQIRRTSSFAEVEIGTSRAAKAAALLVELAMARGSKDNTSVIVVELEETPQSHSVVVDAETQKIVMSDTSALSKFSFFQMCF
ncbi:Protein phosphatase 2C-like protein [Quillaja saponaria]|uniref:protein-serine/threonine phosphatase n=1 Tax=Quillaja saponaria TaxID=32244 RepID=A0AAD7LWG9_QUISA|nr:Protein phosphatase 2C-like protein [Quillaja saponaria]